MIDGMNSLSGSVFFSLIVFLIMFGAVAWDVN
jgi:hypothetical protein